VGVGLFSFSLQNPALAASKKVSDPSAQQTATAINAFAVDVYLQLTKGEENLFFSPYSIVSALAMTCAGAQGMTAEEMEKVLYFPENAPDFHVAMNALQNRLAAIPEEAGTVNTANRLWFDEDTKLLPDYMAFVQKYYGGGAERVDFRENAEGSRKTINDWVAQKTRNKIKGLLRRGNVTLATRLVLTNAVYFNSAWREPFRENLTKEEPFHTGKDRTGEDRWKNVLTMRRTGFFIYGEAPKLQLLKLPYRIPGFSLLILLPRENEAFTQLEDLEQKLSSRELAAWVASMKRRNVSLWLPKFKNEGRYSLKDVLQTLGVKLAFSGDADFSGMVEDTRGKDKGGDKGGDIRIDSVIHQTFIDLDEKGTEAAAATAVAMITSTALPRETEQPIDFHANHPFIYCLMDDITGTILFMGRLVEPQGKRIGNWHE
jgi:serpin B